MTPNQRAEDKWHVGKEIPLAMLLAIFLQTGGGVWWAATQSAKTDYLTEMVRELQRDNYTQADARRDMQISDQRSANNSRRIDALEVWRNGHRRDNQ